MNREPPAPELKVSARGPGIFEATIWKERNMEPHDQDIARNEIAWDHAAEAAGIDLRVPGAYADGRDQLGVERPQGPRKYASSRCKSGMRNWCSCDICF